MTRWHFFTGRQVWDGWAHFRVRIEDRERRGRTQWRYVIERRFVNDEDWKRGRWSTDREKVVRDAEQQLDRLERKGTPVGEYL